MCNMERIYIFCNGMCVFFDNHVFSIYTTALYDDDN